MAECALPGCDVVHNNKKYCSSEHHYQHKRMIRKKHREAATKENPNFTMMNSDLRDRYAAIDAKLDKEDL